MKRHLVAFYIILALFGAVLPAAAQDPEDQPLVTLTDITYLGSFTLPSTDGSGTVGDSDLLQYGGYGLGIGPSGTSLYYGCYGEADTIARVTIPAIGAVGTIAEVCKTVPNLGLVDGTDALGRTIGGTLTYNSRLILSAHAYYDSDEDASSSHFYGANLDGLSGPVAFAAPTRPGEVGGSMVLVPTEWRTAIGGPALSGLWGVSIVGRSSYGPSMAVFDPDDVGVVTPVPATTLLKYTVSAPFGPVDWRGVGIGSLAWPSGFRSVLAVQKVGTGTPCYGVGVSDPAQHLQPRAGGGTNCYDPVNLTINGFHAYPYVVRAYIYDAVHLAEVKAGTRAVSSVQPTGFIDLTQVTTTAGAANFRSAAYDDTTRKWYIVSDAGGTAPRVHVYQFAEGIDTEDPPVDATFSAWAQTATGAYTACLPNGTRTRLLTFERTRLTTATGGGNNEPTDGLGLIRFEEEVDLVTCAGSGALEITVTCTVRNIGAPQADGDSRFTLVTCDDNGAATFARGTQFTVTRPRQ